MKNFLISLFLSGKKRKVGMSNLKTIEVINKKKKNKIKIVNKAINSHIEPTIYGFVYDNRVIKKEWI